ncbi:MAG TPA: ABC transporter permease [Candidatus Acidoferrales bacterium]|nr:ABC transporter permease [Candidatus Acidoferrales bacterium]
MAGKTTMAFGEAVRIAGGSLWSHKLRSVLTLLGVVIGVMSVIAVVSFVNGLNRYVAEKVFTLGADVFVVNRAPMIITNVDQYEESQKRRKFRMDDYEWLRDTCRTCAAVGADLNHPNAQVKTATDYLSNADVLGWSGEMPQLYSYDLMAGRQINQADVLHAHPVCSVGYDIADKLFPGVDPIGKRVRVDTAECEIIGAGKKLGSVMGQSRDNWVVIPITFFQQVYGSDDSVRIWVKAHSAAAKAMQTTMDEVRLLLRARRHVPYRADDDFSIATNDSFLSLWNSISGAFFGVTIAIASISLLVGGIVIMNIMLVSVTERTHEIGLRKSLGARQSDIRLQFLIESSTLAAVGGAWGVALGILLAKVVTWTTSLPSAVQPWSVLMGLFVAISVGLFFGVYPAAKAARLEPVVALRAE